LIGKSNIAEYCINPYIGCQHACKYCYASYYMEKIYGIKKCWGSYVYIKINAVDILKKEILKKEKGSVYISSLTDPYQPLEKKYEIVRKILEILTKNEWNVIVQTKSSLVLRDLDIFSTLKKVKIGVTIISLNKDITNKYETYASSIEERIRILKEIKESKIKNYVFIGPILPFTEFREIQELINYIKDYSDFFFFDKFNLKPNLKEFLIKEFLQDKNIEEMKIYYRIIKEKIKKFCMENKIKFEVLF
ncbi:MAG: radical SAM protein, partial [Candidatus Aenigmatarchaeota archaeon]